MKEEVFNLTKDIVENLIAEARIDRSGVSWDTITSSLGKEHVDRGTRYGLDYGIAGITHFLLSYYKVYKDPRLVEIIDLSLFKVYNYYKRPNVPIGFYNGRGGAIYTLIEAYKVMGSKSYLDKAMDLGDLDYVNPKIYNLESGISGLLLAISHLQTELDVSRYFEKIKRLVDDLIDGTKITSAGVYWDELPIAIRPVTGFLYGNSGIAFALRESLRFFLNPKFFDKVLEEAIAYEDSTFSEETCNWVDFVNEDGFVYNFDLYPSFNPGAKRYEERDFKSGNSFWWGIGSPGMLLIRRELISKSLRLKKSFQKATSILRAHQADADSDFCLYRGIGGLAISLSHIGHTIDSNLIKKGIIEQKRKHINFLSSYPGNRDQIDLSLFRGEAGIGYLLLKIQLEPGPNVLFPYIQNDGLITNKIINTHVNNVILQKNCRLSHGELEVTTNNEKYFELLQKEITRIISCGHVGPDDQISIKKFELFNEPINFRYHEINQEFNQQANTTKIRYLAINSSVKLIKDDRKLLLVRKLGTIEIISLDALTFDVLNQFEPGRKMKMNTLLENIGHVAKATSEKELQELKKKVIRCISDCIRNGILWFE